jgi:hypothetical protein
MPYVAACGISAFVAGGSASGEAVGDLLAPPRELGGGDARVGHLVDHVVDLAAEGVERRDRGAARRRQEQEGVVEAGAAARGLVLHVLLGGHVGWRPAACAWPHA